MAISTINAVSLPYVTNGVTVTFPFTFTALLETDVSVALYDADGAETIANPLDYTVTLTGGGGGDATFAVAPASGYTLYVFLDPDFTQEIDFTNDEFFSTPANEGYDRSASRDHALRRDALRGLLAPIGEAGHTLPPRTNLIAKYLVGDANGDLTTSNGTGADIGLREDLVDADNPSLGAALVAFLSGQTGAVSNNLGERHGDALSVFDFMSSAQRAAVRAGTATDVTAELQAAINTGKSLIFPAGIYPCAGLTQTANFQCFYAFGFVELKKNANDAILTASGDYTQFHGLQFRGISATYTGHNVVHSGEVPLFFNCSSVDATGRALKATGNRVQVKGTSNNWTTADATAAGFDIEIGVTGTATLYHQLDGVNSTQTTGGILLTDVGSHVISNGQCGKISVLSGTSPAGVNGGMLLAMRVLGDVTINLSNSIITGCQFGAATIVTYGVGTSGHFLDPASNVPPSSIVNNGNNASIIGRSVGNGSGIEIDYGADAVASKLTISPNGAAGDWKWEGYFIAGYQRGYRSENSVGAPVNLVNISSATGMTWGDSNYFHVWQASNTGHIWQLAGANKARLDSGGFYPEVNATTPLGKAAQQFTNVYLSGGVYVAATKVVGSQGAALPADASDLATAITLVNAIKARMVAHGLVA